MTNGARTWARVARYLQGVLFFVFGLNGFLHFLPQPPLPTSAVGFATGLMAAGYMFPLIKGTEVIASILLLSDRFVPLALALLAPVIVNIVAFHAFLAPSGLPIPIVVLALELYLAFAYRKAFAPMLNAKVEVSADSVSPVANHSARAAA
jgi:uncharacterized membrane protein YphA (DoxX/SURF4 family)